jgi:hypothetical protein
VYGSKHCGLDALRMLQVASAPALDNGRFTKALSMVAAKRLTRNRLNGKEAGSNQGRFAGTYLYRV